MIRILLALVLLSTVVPAYADKPSVSIVQARKVALARVPGTIVNEKLKTKKHQPSMWSIKIRPRGTPESSEHLVKIEVDAETGAVVKVKDVKARGQRRGESGAD
jgi:uncharacterized membrane protein YkoI